MPERRVWRDAPDRVPAVSFQAEGAADAVWVLNDQGLYHLSS
jgi:hypothetical protein